MTNTKVRKDAKPGSFTVLNVVLDSGERLPCLVESTSWIPVRVATRWAVRYRRYRVQASTLANNLRVVARVYHERFSLTAWNTLRTKATTFPGSALFIAGEWSGSIRTSTVHQMVLTLEAKRLIERIPGLGRSIRLLIPREELPDLE